MVMFMSPISGAEKPRSSMPAKIYSHVLQSFLEGSCNIRLKLTPAIWICRGRKPMIILWLFRGKAVIAAIKSEHFLWSFFPVKQTRASDRQGPAGLPWNAEAQGVKVGSSDGCCAQFAAAGPNFHLIYGGNGYNVSELQKTRTNSSTEKQGVFAGFEKCICLFDSYTLARLPPIDQGELPQHWFVPAFCHAK